jgi:hypothetical protein
MGEGELLSSVTFFLMTTMLLAFAIFFAMVRQLHYGDATLVRQIRTFGLAAR